MKKFRLSPVSVALTAVAAVSLVLRTHISLSGAAVDTMNKFLYLPFSTFLVCVSSVTGLYLKDKRVRYLIVASILCLMNIAVFVVNMMK